MWKELNIVCAEYYVDWIINIRKSYWDGANIGINDGRYQSEFDYVRSLEPQGMIFGGEIYSGWLTHWQEDEMQVKSTGVAEEAYGFLVKHNHSFSMYMAHGGTNFALTAGANAAYREDRGFGGHVTSYDYDAPIN
jgi:hypothetical protein